MGKRLRILSVEDSEADVVFRNRHLTKAGYEIESERVEKAETMRADNLNLRLMSTLMRRAVSHDCSKV